MKKEYILWIIYGLIGYLLLFLIRDVPVVADEVFHYGQIESFGRGDFTIDSYLTTTPLFHYMIFGLDKIFFVNTLEGTRFLLFTVFLILIPPLLYKINRKNLKKTILYLIVPTSFIYFFLVYIDVLSMVFILIAYFCTIRKKYMFGGLFSLIAIFLRQNNIFIVLYFIYYVYVHKDKDFDSKNLLYYTTPIFLFFGYALAKGKVVMGGNEIHPLMIHSNNIFFFGFIFFFLFFHIIFQDKICKKQFLVILLVTIIGLLTFDKINIINAQSTLTYGNLIINIMSNNYFAKALVILISSIAIVYLTKKFNWVLLSLIGIYLAFSWMIDPRYYMIPIVLLLIEFKGIKRWQYWFLLIYWGLLAFLFFLSLLV